MPQRRYTTQHLSQREKSEGKVGGGCQIAYGVFSFVEKSEKAEGDTGVSLQGNFPQLTNKKI